MSVSGSNARGRWARKAGTGASTFALATNALAKGFAEPAALLATASILLKGLRLLSDLEKRPVEEALPSAPKPLLRLIL